MADINSHPTAGLLHSLRGAPQLWVKHEPNIQKKSGLPEPLLPASDWLPRSPLTALKADCKSTLRETRSPSASSSSLQSECEMKCQIRQTGGICNSWLPCSNKNSCNLNKTFLYLQHWAVQPYSHWRSQWQRTFQLPPHFANDFTSQGCRKTAKPLLHSEGSSS